MRLALQLNSSKHVHDIFLECDDDLTQKQLSYMLGRQQYLVQVVDCFVSRVFQIVYYVPD